MIAKPTAIKARGGRSGRRVVKAAERVGRGKAVVTGDFGRDEHVDRGEVTGEFGTEPSRCSILSSVGNRGTRWYCAWCPSRHGLPASAQEIQRLSVAQRA